MKKVKFNNAYYLKLGRAGKWEGVLQDGTKARIGWSEINIKDLQHKRWTKINAVIEADYKERGKKTGATQDFNALKSFCEATDEDILVTFSDSKLYWCLLDNSTIQQDEISKYRTTKINWCCTDIEGKILYLTQISGKISKTQGFRGTLCSIQEIETLTRTINALKAPLLKEIESRKSELLDSLNKAIATLHWHDMELLTDLIFRQSGWRRISMLGKSMKFMDLELEEPITKNRYQVQVKAKAGKKDFEEYADEYTGLGYHKLFFVVFSPDKNLLDTGNQYPNIELITGNKLSELIFDLGLTDWVLQKVH